ncbi:Calcium-transporting ATPase 12, plasma membrane-type [Ancistrocladus abbreviatus]
MQSGGFQLSTSATLFLNTSPIATMRARKRWHTARAKIYSLRALLSVVKENVHGSNYRYDYRVIEIEPCHDENTPVIANLCSNNETQLAEITEERYMDGGYDTIHVNNHDDISWQTESIKQAQLTQIVKDKNLDTLRTLGGVNSIANALKTNTESGICDSSHDISWRQDTYGLNIHERPPSRAFLYFVWTALQDPTLLILIVCAALALGFGIKEHGLEEGWYEGGSIIVAVVLVVVVSAVSNFKQERQFDKLSKISDNITVDVLRDGRQQQISIFDIVVGDIIFLNAGDQVPADGLFIDGYSLALDESSMTGESDPVEVNLTNNPFLHSGSKVAAGYARMLVTSVGMNTAWGEMMSSINHDSSEQTPLQVRLNSLTSSIGKVGLAVASLVLVALLARYFTGNTEDENGNKEYNGSKTGVNSVLNSIVGIVAAAVTIVVVAIPEGLPLAVTLTLAYSMKRMMADQAMVRKLSACETMGSATVICTDKTGTLTLNEMRVTKFWVGEEVPGEKPLIAANVLELLQQGVGLNTTGSIYTSDAGAVPEISGCPTEKAILSWAVRGLGMEIDRVKQNCSIVHVETFNSEKKRSGVLVKKVSDSTFHVHWKGAAEIILAMCSNYYTTEGILKAMDEDGRTEIRNVIEGMAASSLRCIAFAHMCITQELLEYDKNEKSHPMLCEDGLTLLGIIGLKDPCRPEVKNAVEVCRGAGVDIKMITGDNVFTAKAIATECGILRLDEQEMGGQVVEGSEFRNYTDEQRMKEVDKIRIMARSTPLDKLLMVKCLKKKGHVVAVTGDGTNDAPALKEADIGLSMGIQGTEVAKESSDIVILDDNFNTVVTVLRWGRCVYNNIQKFIQFQLTVNVAALVINFIAAVSAGEVPLTAVQMLWVNLIMDTLGALALATESPTKELLGRPPVGRTEPLITNIIWRNLLAQSLYQIAVLLTLQFRGESIFKVSKDVKDTLIFNAFVLCQVFNEFNSRRLQKKNVFEGIHRNTLFIGIVGITIVLQVLMVELLRKFANTERLNGLQWGACIIIAAVSWPIGWLVKFIPVPEEPFFSSFPSSKQKVLHIIRRFLTGFMKR